jgi:hypothetical protein
MSARDVDGLPPYPDSPLGVPRVEHLPTVEASILYWDAMRHEAARTQDLAGYRTAVGLRLSYEAARRELIKSPKNSGRRPPSQS